MHFPSSHTASRSLPVRLFPLFFITLPAAAAGPTLIPSGGTVTLPSAAGIGSILQFGSGVSGTDATLQITGGGLAQIFSGTWIVDSSNPVFDLSPGVALVIQPGGIGQTFGTPSFLQLSGGGSLTLGPGSYLPGWTSGLGVLDGGTLTIGDRDWFLNSQEIAMGADGTNTTLRYIDDRAATYFGVFDVGAAGPTSTVDITSGSRTTGDLTLSGVVQGAGDLRILNSGGLSATSTVVLNFGSGSYSGELLLDGARVQLDSARGIGTDGLAVLNASTLTIGSSITTGASQTMNLQDDLTINGDVAGRRLTWNGALTGSGSIDVQNGLRLSFGGTASTFAGDLSIGAGSSLAMQDLSGLAARGAAASLTMNNGDFTYTGATAVSLAAQLNLSGTANTFASLQAGAQLGLTGALASGYTGDVDLIGPGPITFSPTGSTYSGFLVLDGANATIGTANAIGGSGLKVAGASTLTLAKSITTGASQVMDLRRDLVIQGATGLQQLTWNGDINLGTLNNLTLRQMQLTMGSGGSLTGTIDEAVELGSGGILSLNGITTAVTIVGSGGLLAGPGTVGQIGIPGTSSVEGFLGTIQLGNGSTRGVLQSANDAHLANAFIESLLYTGSTTADKLAVGGSLTGLNQASVNVIYNATTAGGPLIPATNDTLPKNYTIMTAGTMPGEVPKELVLSILDPLNNQYSVLLLDPSNPNTDASGAQFTWSTTPGAAGSGVFTITGAPNSTISVPGSTQTNIGSVNNTQLVSAVNQISTINQRPAQTSDAQYVGATLLLLSPQILPGAIVTAAVAANPDALPNTTFNSMSQAGQVAKLRLMEVRDGGIGNAAARANGQDTFQPSDNPDDGDFRTCALDQLSPGADTATQSLGVNAGINGASPQDGARVWGRGYGFYENVNGQSYAQGDYSAAMGGVMFGADASLDGGLLAGGFAGFTPGDLSIQSTLGNTQISLMGLNFGGYASWSPQDGASYVQGYAMAGYNQADQTRNIQIPGLIRTANSTANVWGAMVGGEGGLNLKLGDKAVLQPYVSLDYGYYTRGSYNETGAGSLDLSVSSQDANLLQPMGGARVMQSFDVGRDRITPFVGAAFVAQLPLGSWSESATNGFSGAQVFSYSEGADNQYGASFQAGLEFATANRWTAYISFNGMAMTDTTVYGGQIGINIPF